MTVADKAKQIYERDLKEQLEASYRNKFVAIEPDSKSYFIGDTFVEAAMAAKTAHPQRISFVIRIGHAAAFHLGAAT